MFSKGTENVSKVEWYLQSIDTDRLEDLLSWSRTGRSRIAAVLDTSSYLIVEMMCCTCVSVISQWRSEFLQCQRSIGYTVCIRTTYMHSLTHASTARHSTLLCHFTTLYMHVYSECCVHTGRWHLSTAQIYLRNSVASVLQSFMCFSFGILTCYWQVWTKRNRRVKQASKRWDRDVYFCSW